MIGLLTGRDGGVNPYPLMFKGGAIHGVYVGDRAMFLEMNRAIEVSGVKPVIDRVFPFEQAIDGLQISGVRADGGEGRHSNLIATNHQS